MSALQIPVIDIEVSQLTQVFPIDDEKKETERSQNPALNNEGKRLNTA